MVIERTRDLGVLKSLGAPPRGIVGLFLRLGMILCAAGILIGTLAAWGFTANINKIHDLVYAVTGRRLFPPDIYYFTEIPVTYRWVDWAVVLGASVIFGFLGSLIPAVLAARRDPVKALHHE